MEKVRVIIRVYLRVKVDIFDIRCIPLFAREARVRISRLRYKC